MFKSAAMAIALSLAVATSKMGRVRVSHHESIEHIFLQVRMTTRVLNSASDFQVLMSWTCAEMYHTAIKKNVVFNNQT